MDAPPAPWNEAERLAELLRYEILDTPPDEAFEDLVAIAAAACGTPMATVTLIDRHRQWIKAAIGMEAGECRREDSFCTCTILAPDELLVVPDASLDARFRDNPFVTTPPHVRFYAGAPLVTAGGHALGALCVLDVRPRELSQVQLRALRGLARQAVAQMELRRTHAELRHHASERVWYEHQLELAQRQLAEENAQLAQASLTDELTGLPNRRAANLYLRHVFDAAIADGANLAVAIVDIDLFKAINDRHGHPVGDEVLVTVGRLLAGHAAGETMVARFGGEEFVVVLPGRSLDAAEAVCEAMREAVAVLEGIHPVTVSIGLTACVPGDDLGSIYSRADTALYRAKAAGRNRVVAYRPPSGLSG